MMRWLLRTAVAIVVNAVALLVAALVLDGFTIRVLPFLTVALIFTIASIVIKPIADAVAGRYAPGVASLAGLVTVILALLAANALAGDAITIDGLWTWVWAVLIIWAATLVYGLVDNQVIKAVTRRIAEPGADA